MKPKLYQYAACPFCSKVASVLKYKGVDYDIVEVHPLNKKELAFSPEYRAVPIYIDSTGKQVNDSTPIMRHIDAEFPDKRVFRGENEDQWLTWSEDFVQGLPTAVYGDLASSLKSFDYITKVGKFSWFQQRMVKYSGALVMTMVAKKIAKRRNITDPVVFLRSKTEEWTKGLEGRDYMGGSEPNAADLAVFGIARIVAPLSAGKTFRENAAFWAWLERVAQKTHLSLATNLN